MDPSPQGAPHLSEIATLWTVVHQAHHGSTEVVGRAQQELMERYSGSVYRYLLGALRDRDAADDLFQEFALRFLRGDFKNANPERGRFRDFVKTALFHLIVDHQNRRKARPQTMAVEEGGLEPATYDLHYSEQEFLLSWRNEVLSRAWEALAADSPVYYRVLRLRAEQPDLSSAQMAERLSAGQDKPVKPDWVRQTLKRARERFAELLLADLASSLETPSRERLEQELTDLQLLHYCQQALQQWS
jgi:RNA polymerase sigma-70 factor (ECF subfamily)